VNQKSGDPVSHAESQDCFYAIHLDMMDRSLHSCDA